MLKGWHQLLYLAPLALASAAAHRAGAGAMAAVQEVEVAVVGGGLAGLLVAEHLAAAGRSFALLEASGRLGGRLRNSDRHGIDMGAAWCWPPPRGGQTGIRDLLARLEIATFPQPDDPGSTRIAGGAAAIPATLGAALPAGSVELNWALAAVEDLGGGGEGRGGVLLRSSSGAEVTAKVVVVAAPPAVVAARVSFEPELPLRRVDAMKRAHVWMAGVTKVALRFEERFWPLGQMSNTGLRGGPNRPAFQLYDSGDASDKGGAALTFFTVAEEEDDAALAKQCAEQLAELWEMAGMDREAISALKAAADFEVQRWPKEELISLDAQPHHIHPHPAVVPLLAAPEWEGRLLWAGTETDQRDPGVMEGAIGSAARVIRELAK